MKRLVQQGEQLYEERKSKELTKALDMVDAAEEVNSLTHSFTA
jgi:hypothetical protein